MNFRLLFRLRCVDYPCPKHTYSSATEAKVTRRWKSKIFPRHAVNTAHANQPDRQMSISSRYLYNTEDSGISRVLLYFDSPKILRIDIIRLHSFKPETVDSRCSLRHSVLESSSLTTEVREIPDFENYFQK
jgi:hypothetical protein